MRKSSLHYLIDGIQKQDSFRVIVAGSKENPVFPIENPDIYVGAHGGIFHADRFPESTLKIGVISNWLLFSQATYCDTVRSLVKDVRLDYLIIIESIHNKLEDISPSSFVQLDNTSVLRLSSLTCTLLEFKFLWPDYFVCLLSRLSLRKLFGLSLQLFTERTSYLTRLSTGMFSVLFFFHLLPLHSILYVSGIGLQLSGSYFFDSSKKMQKGGHYAQDIFVANKLSQFSSNNNSSVEFTDSDALKVLAELNNVPFMHYLNRYISSIPR
jgi:hypothetical protein